MHGWINKNIWLKKDIQIDGWMKKIKKCGWMDHKNIKCGYWIKKIKKMMDGCKTYLKK